MNAFDNTNLVTGLCGGCDCTGFAANLTFVYDANAHTIVVTDGSTYPGGDSRKIVNLRVSDKNCKVVDGNISASDGDNAVTISTTTLDLSEGFVINATVVTAAGCISDGHFGRIGMIATSGSLGSWDRDSNKIIISNVGSDDES